MGSEAALVPTGSQRQFTGLLLGGIAVMAMAIAFGQHDRRGLLLYDQPEAFAANELAELSSPAGLAQGVAVSRVLSSGTLPRQVRRSRISGAVQPPAFGADGGAVAGPTSALEPLGLSNSEPSLASAGTSTGQGLSQPGLALTNLAAPGTGISPTPLVVPAAAPGVVPIDPGIVPNVPDSVVPAVPEPASWILMIIGIGVLGAVMRQRRHHFGQLVATR